MANFWHGKKELEEIASRNIALFADSTSKLQYIHAIKWFYYREDKKIDFLDRKKYFMEQVIPLLTTSEIFLDTALLDGEYYNQAKKILGEEVKAYFGFCLFPTGSGNMRNGVLEGEPGNINGIRKVKRVGFMKPFTEERIYNIQYVRIDDIMQKTKYTFLRGYSMESLMPIIEGAIQTIKKYRPICALNIGHFEQDFIGIPQVLKKLLPNYEYLFRQHSYQGSDCIFYAIPNERILTN